MKPEDAEEPVYPSAVSVGVGSVAGAVTTSSAAITAAGTGGVAGYFAGIGSLIAHAGCEIAAFAGLGAVVAGPLVGGMIGYGLYRGIKEMVRDEE